MCDLQRHTGERTYTYTSINCSIYVGVLRRKNLYIFLYKIYVYVLIVLCSCLVVCFQQQQKSLRERKRWVEVQLWLGFSRSLIQLGSFQLLYCIIYIFLFVVGGGFNISISFIADKIMNNNRNNTKL